MIGINREVVIDHASLTFINTRKLVIKNITLSNGKLDIHVLQYSKMILSSVIFTHSTLYIIDVNVAQLTNCEFINESSPLTIRKSKVTLSGSTKFLDNYNSALVSYGSSITLSGTVLFVNNSGIRGGAMALYSSTMIFLQNELNVSFIDNTAEETGGAIHIEPDMTRISCPECFYKVQGHTHKAFYYSNNIAKFGGHDIYGTSLALCEHLEHNHTYKFAPNASMSSVSSDPRQVCLCNSDGQPQCENLPHILTNKRIYPGEKFTIPAVIVGGDYGTTIGTIYTNFKSSNLLSVPVLKSKYMYSQWMVTFQGAMISNTQSIQEK